MTSPDAPHLLASFAPAVSEAAEVDGVALGLCQEAGTALGDALLAAGSGLSAPVLVATGGLLASAPVRQALECRLAGDGRALSASQGGPSTGRWPWPRTCWRRARCRSTRIPARPLRGRCAACPIRSLCAIHDLWDGLMGLVSVRSRVF